jgi:hypothetical protein
VVLQQRILGRVAGVEQKGRQYRARFVRREGSRVVVVVVVVKKACRRLAGGVRGLERSAGAPTPGRQGGYRLAALAGGRG